jgi:S1-C subfamily serine protease
VPADLRAKLKIDGGALVTQVLDESPAAAAGLAVNDVIVEVQGTPVSSANLSSVVAGLKPDQEVNVTYFHDGNRVTKPAKLADREKFFAARAAKAAPAPAKKEPVVLGVTVLEKDGALHVEAVDDGFTGGVAGLKAGDKITHLNGKELKTLEDIAGELKKVVEGDKLVIIHKRGDETITVNVVGAHGKDGAKVVARESKKPQPKEEPKPAEPKPAEKKPGLLGVAVVPDAAGVVVESVLGDTAAAAAGIQKGDVIKKANGHEIADVDALKGILSKLSAGDKVSLEVLREGKSVELKDIVLKAEGDKVASAKPPEKPPEKKPEEAPKPPKAKQKGALGILATQTVDQKVVVRSVNPGGAAEKADLKPGDVFLKINDKAVAGFGDLESVLQALFAGDSVTIRVLRGTEEKDIKVTLGEA